MKDKLGVYSEIFVTVARFLSLLHSGEVEGFTDVLVAVIKQNIHTIIYTLFLLST